MAASLGFDDLLEEPKTNEKKEKVKKQKKNKKSKKNRSSETSDGSECEAAKESDGGALNRQQSGLFAQSPLFARSPFSGLANLPPLAKKNSLPPLTIKAKNF